MTTPSTSVCDNTPLLLSLFVLQAFTHTPTHTPNLTWWLTVKDQTWSLPVLWVMLSVTVFQSLLRATRPWFEMAQTHYWPLPIRILHFPHGERSVSCLWFSTGRKHWLPLHSYCTCEGSIHPNCTHLRFTLPIYIAILCWYGFYCNEPNKGAFKCRPSSPKSNQKQQLCHSAGCVLGNATAICRQLNGFLMFSPDRFIFYRIEPAILCKQGNVQFVPVHQCSHFCYFKLTFVLFFVMSSTASKKTTDKGNWFWLVYLDSEGIS